MPYLQEGYVRVRVGVQVGGGRGSGSSPVRSFYLAHYMRAVLALARGIRKGLAMRGKHAARPRAECGGVAGLEVH